LEQDERSGEMNGRWGFAVVAGGIRIGRDGQTVKEYLLPDVAGHAASRI
jgi:hypothetical protein